MKESPIFLKTHDMLVWLMQMTLKFPKSQRFVMAKRVQRCGLDFYDDLVAAVKSQPAVESLVKADLELERLRHHLRLCRDLQLMSLGQYEHIARQIETIGKLLGGWLKTEKGDPVKGAGRCSSRRLLEQQQQELPGSQSQQQQSR